ITPAAINKLFNANGLVSIFDVGVSAGVITTLPLLCFPGAATRLKLSTLGFFQYIGPSLMFLLAVLMYGEPFSMDKAITFAFIGGG
ncbi:hypothetical protein ACXWQW_09540, partial [Streptococcus pyogenes]